MRRNKKLVKQMMVVPLTAALVTNTFTPWTSMNEVKMPFSMVAFADEMQSETVTINLNELKTDFAEDSGVVAQIYNDKYNLDLMGNKNKKYVIKGSNYVNGAYTEVSIYLYKNVDVYFDNVYIKNTQGEVWVTTKNGEKSYSFNDSNIPIYISGEGVTISGNAVIDTFNDKNYDMYSKAIDNQYNKVTINNANILTNGGLHYNNIVSDKESTILGISDNLDGLAVYSPEIKDKSIKGYRLYKDNSVVNEHEFEHAVKTYRNSLGISISKDYSYDKIDIITDDGEVCTCKYYDVEDTEGNTVDSLFCKENDVSALPVNMADHVEYTYKGNIIVRNTYSHKVGEWEYDENGKGISRCVYCGKVMDECEHGERGGMISATGGGKGYKWYFYELSDSVVDGIELSYIGIGREVYVYAFDGFSDDELSDTYDNSYSNYLDAKKDEMSLVYSGMVTDYYIKLPETDKHKYYCIYFTEQGSYDTTERRISWYGYNDFKEAGTLSPTCNSVGYSIQKCSKCGRITSKTPDGTESLKHNVIHYDMVDSTCTEEGNIEYWECTDCNKKYSDEECRNEISDADIVIVKKPHSYGTKYNCTDLTGHMKVCDGCDYIDSENVIKHEFVEKDGKEICVCGLVKPYITSEEDSMVYGGKITMKAEGPEVEMSDKVKYQWYEKLTDEADGEIYNAEDLADATKYKKIDGAETAEFSTPSGTTVGEHTYICVVSDDTTSLMASKSITVTKAEPSYTVPANQSIKCNETLNNIILPKGFTFENADRILEIGKDNKVLLTFTPDDTDNYNVVKGIEITVSVADHGYTKETVGDKYIKSSATCGHKAVYYRSCSECGESSEDDNNTFEVGEKLSHTYGKPVFNWSADGKNCELIFTCTSCDEKAEGHVKKVQGTVTDSVKQAATCGAKGITTYTVTYVEGEGKDAVTYTDSKDVEDIAKLTAHTYGKPVFNWSTDGKNCGLTFTCTSCDEKAEGHVKKVQGTVTDSVKQAATCGAKGITTYTVTYVEGEGKDAVTYTDSKDVEDIEKLTTHTFGEWTIVKEATEDETGLRERSCECGYKQTEEIERLEHKTHIKDEGTRVEPTCTKAGSVTYKCTKCGDVMEVVKLPAEGHKWNNGKTVRKATEKRTGLRRYTCSGCGKTKSVTIPKKQVTLPKKGTVITSDNGLAKYVIIDVKKKTVAYRMPVNKTNKNISIPEEVEIKGIKCSVVTISGSAFKNNSKLTNVVIPATVTTIGKDVFRGTKSLKTITIKSTKLTSKSVSKYTFRGLGENVTIKVSEKKQKAYKKLFKKCGLKGNKIASIK